MSKPGFLCTLRSVFVPIYGQHLNILVMDDYQEAWLAFFADSKYKPHENAKGSTVFRNGQGWMAVRRDATAGTVAHEALHLAAALLHYVGVKFKTFNHEAYTYLLAWLVEEIEAARAEKPTLHTPD